MARGDSLTRQLKLMQILDERRELVVPRVATELGYTPRTVYRDLRVLEQIGVPIFQDPSRGRPRWRVLDTYRKRLSVTLSYWELLALTTGRELLLGMAGSVFHESAVSALEKIRSALPAELVKRADSVGRALSALSGPKHDYGARREMAQVVIDGVEQGRLVQLRYRKPGGRPETRGIEPHHLHVQAGGMYVIGFDRRRSDWRTFAMERIDEAQLLPDRFARRPDFAARGFLQGAFGPWSGPAVKVRLRFSEVVAPFVSERQMHASQANQLRTDGTLDVSFEAPISPGMLHWVVGYGPDVAVLAPRTLAKAVANAHRKGARPRVSQASIRVSQE